MAENRFAAWATANQPDDEPAEPENRFAQWATDPDPLETDEPGDDMTKVAPGVFSRVLDVATEAAKTQIGGTGFLVGARLVLTAMHVVGDRTQKKIYPGPIKLTFPNATVTAKVYGDHWDPVADWALLECDDLPSGVTPLTAFHPSA